MTESEQIMDLFEERKRGGRRIGGMMGMEGGHGMDASLGSLRMFKELGVSYMTLVGKPDDPVTASSRSRPPLFRPTSATPPGPTRPSPARFTTA